MKNVILFIGLLLVVSVGQSGAFNVPFIFYGDDQVDAWDGASENAKKMLSFTGVQLDIGLAQYLKSHPAVHYDLSLLSSDLSLTMGLCKDGQLANQAKIGRCSAFLVGEDYLVTAAHCLPLALGDEKESEAILQSQCDRATWAIGVTHQNFSRYASDDLRYCEKVVYYSHQSQDDLALIKLKVAPYRWSQKEAYRSAKIKLSSKVEAVGSTLGTSLRPVSDGEILFVGDDYFLTNLSLFAGASGAPVFNQDGLLGMALGGEDDLEWNTIKRCFQARRLPKDQGAEKVLSVQKINQALLLNGLSEL